ncbi:MAG: hypothetical protein LBQ41_00135 [Candidatus Ancillula sp.]|jgi:predicted DNA-binding transcriptional regulator YafY|nr:hypothetical protein [Candidatus Ancillula sp.]
MEVAIRLLRLLRFLINHPDGVTKFEIFNALDDHYSKLSTPVATRQFQRDKNLLQEVGVTLVVEKKPEGRGGFLYKPKANQLVQIILTEQEYSLLRSSHVPESLGDDVERLMQKLKFLTLIDGVSKREKDTAYRKIRRKLRLKYE